MAWVEKRPTGYLVRWRNAEGRKLQAFFVDEYDALEFMHRKSAAPHRRSRRLTSLEAYADETLKAAEDLRESTRYHYLGMMRKHIGPAIGHLALAEVKGPELRSFFVGMREAGYSHSYRALAHQVLARTFRLAAAEGLIEQSPLASVPMRGGEYRRDVVPLEVQDVERLASFIRGRYRAAVFVMAYAGLRVGEVGGLTTLDVNILHRELRVQSTVARAGGRLFLSPPKTAAGRRSIPLPTFLADELAFHIEVHGIAPDGRIFHTPGVNQHSDAFGLLHASSLHKPFKAARLRAGLVQATPHTLRHTYATLLVREGAHPKLVQTLMGHSSIKVTMDLYGHLFPGMGAELATKLHTRHEKDMRPESGGRARA
jgi:integrase